MSDSDYRDYFITWNLWIFWSEQEHEESCAAVDSCVSNLVLIIATASYLNPQLFSFLSQHAICEYKPGTSLYYFVNFDKYQRVSWALNGLR